MFQCQIVSTDLPPPTVLILQYSVTEFKRWLSVTITMCYTIILLAMKREWFALQAYFRNVRLDSHCYVQSTSIV